MGVMTVYRIVPAHPPFDYGSSVRVSATPSPYGLSQGSVCGFRTIDDHSVAEKRGVAVGTVYVLVESESGLTMEIPANELEIV
jgi:hypothetical protein